MAKAIKIYFLCGLTLEIHLTDYISFLIVFEFNVVFDVRYTCNRITIEYDLTGLTLGTVIQFTGFLYYCHFWSA